jgi:acetoin utilization protein AcuB
MLVEQIMTKNVVTLKKEDSIKQAYTILQENRFHHIPIIDDKNNVIGIISDRDIRDAWPSIFEKDWDNEVLETPVERIMKTDVKTVHPFEFVEEIAAIFYEKEISCLPVVREGNLVGIVTDKDMLNTLISLTGALTPSSQIEIKIKNVPGALANIVNLIAEERLQIDNVLVYPDQLDDSYKIIVLRVQTMNPYEIVNKLKSKGHNVLWPNFPGISDHV